MSRLNSVTFATPAPRPNAPGGTSATSPRPSSNQDSRRSSNGRPTYGRGENRGVSYRSARECASTPPQNYVAERRQQAQAQDDRKREPHTPGVPAPYRMIDRVAEPRSGAGAGSG